MMRLKLVGDDSQKVKVVINLLVLSLSLYAVSKRNASFAKTSIFEKVMIDSFAPLQKGVSYMYDSVNDLLEHYIANVNASKRNDHLRERIAQLESAWFKYSEVKKENLRLKKLLIFSDSRPGQKVLAQIVSWDASSDFRMIRVNKGLDDGVKLQSPVVTFSGLVGYVFRLTNHFSDILTIMDSNNRVDGIVARSRSHGILEGGPKNSLYMKYVNRTEPIILDDLIVTSGLGNLYPKGIRVGQVSRIERESFGITQTIEVKASVNFSALEELIILIPKDNDAKRLELQALDGKEDGGIK